MGRMSNTTHVSRSRRKPVYHIRNWNSYDQALVQRGSLTFWVSNDLVQTWQPTGAKQRGAQFTYSDHAITLMLTVKEVFHLTNRVVEGFVRSVFQLLKLALPVPDHSTLSKRGKTLTVALPKKGVGPLHVVMDSTGLKIYGEGEWKVRMHGKSKRRTWRKLHVGVDPISGEIQAVALTENSVSDEAMVEPLLEQIAQPIDAMAGDGSYDTRRVYRSLQTHAPHARVLIPPRKGARIWQHGNTQAERLPRDQNVRAIRQQGRKAWKDESGYHMRSLAETTMFRLKTIFGNALSARLLATQGTQALIRCAALNQMTHLGMPESYKVA